MASNVFRRGESSCGFSSTGFRRESGENSEKEKVYPAVIKSICIGFGAALVLLMLISIIAAFYDVPDAVLNYCVIFISIICLFLVGFKAASCNEKNGLLIGVIAGTLYAILVFLIGCICFRSISFSPELIANLAIGGAVGGLGGVVGINRLSAKNRRKRR